MEQKKCLHTKRVEHRQDWFGATTWLLFHKSSPGLLNWKAALWKDFKSEEGPYKKRNVFFTEFLVRKEIPKPNSIRRAVPICEVRLLYGTSIKS